MMTISEWIDDKQPIVTGSNLQTCVDLCAANTLCVGVGWNERTGACALQKSTGNAVATVNGICAAIRIPDSPASQRPSTLSSIRPILNIQSASQSSRPTRTAPPIIRAS
ncbi:hypothetical protein DPSP01_013943 [Paraphaeosphaeria sporulosa]